MCGLLWSAEVCDILCIVEGYEPAGSGVLLSCSGKLGASLGIGALPASRASSSGRLCKAWHTSENSKLSLLDSRML
eukprot:1266944-Amphidinium_carterae.1